MNHPKYTETADECRWPEKSAPPPATANAKPARARPERLIYVLVEDCEVMKLWFPQPASELPRTVTDTLSGVDMKAIKQIL